MKKVNDLRLGHMYQLFHEYLGDDNESLQAAKEAYQSKHLNSFRDDFIEPDEIYFLNEDEDLYF